MRQTVAFHPFVGGTMFYGDKLPFDLPNDAIQKCAEQLLQELRRANSSENTEMIIF